MRNGQAPGRPARPIVGWVFALSVIALAACGDFLDPIGISDDAGGGSLADPATAELQVDSAIALFECGYSTFGWVALGYEDVLEPWAESTHSAHVFRSTPPAGPCDQSDASQTWFDPIMEARRMVSNSDGTGVYDRLQNEWEGRLPVAESARLSAIAATYAAATLGHFGEFYCEMAFDQGPLLSPDDVLAEAELWAGRALGHIEDAAGDFEMPRGIAASAETMATALRARIRWARGDAAGAMVDAEAVPAAFAAWVTRDAAETRTNKIHLLAALGIHRSFMQGLNDWWAGADSPVTGQPWPSPLPFTGYLFLGVLPDGRAVDDGGYAIRWAEKFRDPGTMRPISLENGAVPDTRVGHDFRVVAGPLVPEAPERYRSIADDIPLVTWKEMWLIRAEIQGGQAAIDLVNDLRTAEGLPPVTYITGSTATPQDIRYLILEERRRSFFAEGGRYWATKIRNTDVLWFPRGEGATPYMRYPLQGGVRLTMPTAEYDLNPNLSPADRGSGCDPAEAPVL